MQPASSGVNPTASPAVLTYADAFAALDAALAAVRTAREGASERALSIADSLAGYGRVDLTPIAPDTLSAYPERVADYNAAVRIAQAALAVRAARRVATIHAEREDAEEAGRRILGESGVAGPREAEVHANGRGDGADGWLSLYRVELRDGGPEEGGWHWTRRELVAAVRRSNVLRADDDALTSDGDADVRATLASVAEAHGLTLASHFVERADGTLRAPRGYRSASPEVDAELIPERVVGENVNTCAPSYE